MGKNILFICTGNTCRSAMATYLAADIQEREYPEANNRFDSAGLYASPGAPPSDLAVEVLDELNIDMRSHRAKAFSSYMIDQADLILTMTNGHYDALVANFPKAKDKTFVLGDFADLPGNIADPFGGSYGSYVITRDDLKDKISAFLKKISTP